jgi:hypothetical protein
LKSLSISDCSVNSWKPIADRLETLDKNELHFISQSCKLRCLYLDGLFLGRNAAFRKLLNGDRTEARALKMILWTFKQVSSISKCYIGGKERCPTDVEYLLQINHAGRYLLETNDIGNNRYNRNSTDNSGSSDVLAMAALETDQSHFRCGHLYWNDLILNLTKFIAHIHHCPRLPQGCITCYGMDRRYLIVPIHTIMKSVSVQQYHHHHL